MNEKYLHYKLNDYLEDDEFIAHVKSGHPEKELWEEWIIKHPNHESIYRDAIRILELVKFKKHELSKTDEDSLWDGIESASLKTRHKSRRVLFRTIGVASIAAAILLIFVLGWVFANNRFISTFAGETVEFKLPDDSEIHINAMSSIRFQKRNFTSDRLVKMDGEVMFDVTKGTEFRVETTLGSVDVLGTRFNVYNRDSLLRVICYEGKVKVITASNDSTILMPFEGLYYNSNNGVSSKKKLTENKINSWTSGVFEFDHVPLSLVFEEIKRQFDVYLIFDPEVDLETSFYTGIFTKGDLDKALYDVCWPMKLSYEVNGKQVNIGIIK